MDLLKKIFPFSFGVEEVKTLVIRIIIYVVVGVVVSVLFGILSNLPAVGSLIAVLGALVGGVLDLYITAGIVLMILAYCKVLK